MSNFEEPIFPPPESKGENRYESSDLNIEDLRAYLAETVFENEKEITQMLINQYKMYRRKSADEIESNMTRIFTREELQNRAGALGKPLSGVEPIEVLQTTLMTTENTMYDLKIFKVFNRNDSFRFEYILKPKSEDAK